MHQPPQDGYYLHIATYKKLPAARTRRKQVVWFKPGYPTIETNGYNIVAGSKITRLASVEVSYSTTQDTTAPFTINAWASLKENYKITDGNSSIQQHVLNGILATATSQSSATPVTYNGIPVDRFFFAFYSSDPAPGAITGTKLIEVDNDEYLTDSNGVVVFKISKTSITI